MRRLVWGRCCWGTDRRVCPLMHSVFENLLNLGHFYPQFVTWQLFNLHTIMLLGNLSHSTKIHLFKTLNPDFPSFLIILHCCLGLKAC